MKRVVFGAFVSVILAGCGDALFVSPAPRIPAGLAIAYSLALSQNSDAGAVFDKADRIHVRVAGNGMLVDTVLAFVPAAEARVRVPVSVAEPGRTYQVNVELRRNTDVLFTGGTTATLTEGQTVTAQIALAPVFTSVTLPTSIPAFRAVGDTLTIQATGIFATGDTLQGGAQNQSFAWRSSNDSIATADANGLVTARRGGIALIRATLPGGATATVEARVVAANDIAGFWSGTYSWSCSPTNSGTSQISFNISVQPGSPDFTGLATFLGGSGGLSGSRYQTATLSTQGDVRTGVKSTNGPIINIVVPLSVFYTFNIFTGTLSGTRITGTTLNGERCSAASGPSGSFSVQKQ